MKNEDVLELIRQCDLKEGEVLIPGKAYLFNKRFSHNQPGEKEEIIVLTKNEIKVGGIYVHGYFINGLGSSGICRKRYRLIIFSELIYSYSYNQSKNNDNRNNDKP